MAHFEKNTSIGPFSLHILDDGDVEFRTFGPMDRNILTVEEAFELWQWLDQARQTAVFPQPLVTPPQERERARTAYRELHPWLNSLDEEIRL